MQCASTVRFGLPCSRVVVKRIYSTGRAISSFSRICRIGNYRVIDVRPARQPIFSSVLAFDAQFLYGKNRIVSDYRYIVYYGCRTSGMVSSNESKNFKNSEKKIDHIESKKSQNTPRETRTKKLHQPPFLKEEFSRSQAIHTRAADRKILNERIYGSPNPGRTPNR